jgi:hypothetical protein
MFVRAHSGFGPLRPETILRLSGDCALQILDDCATHHSSNGQARLWRR